MLSKDRRSHKTEGKCNVQIFTLHSIWMNIYLVILFETFCNFICVASLPNQILHLLRLAMSSSWRSPVMNSSTHFLWNGSQISDSNIRTPKSHITLQTLLHCSGPGRREMVRDYHNQFGVWEHPSPHPIFCWREGSRFRISYKWIQAGLCHPRLISP